MGIFSTPLFVWIWQIIGAIILIYGLIGLGKSAIDSVKNARSSSSSVLWSIMDELFWAILLIAGVTVFFFLNDLTSSVGIFVGIVTWFYTHIVAPTLRHFNIPV